MIKNNCKDCQNRTIDCHSWCEDYKQYRKEVNKYNEVYRNDHLVNDSPYYREGWQIKRKEKR